MLPLQASHKAQNGQISKNADILAFPCPMTTITAKEPDPEGDYIDQRMLRPMRDDEMKAVLHMIQQRAKMLGQELWVATGHFLLDMGIEDLDDLRRCDLVRAVEHLMPSALLSQTYNA